MTCRDVGEARGLSPASLFLIRSEQHKLTMKSPESHPESSSAFGWTFCLSVVLGVLCNLLPGELHRPRTRKLQTASVSHVTLHTVSSGVSVSRDRFIAEADRAVWSATQPTGQKEADERKHVLSYWSRSIPISATPFSCTWASLSALLSVCSS